jgi:hypothetical protein
MPPRPPALTREQFLASPVRELGAYWLEMRCPGCGKLTQLPLKLMAARARRPVLLRDALPKLACADCGARPTTASVIDDLGGGDPSKKVPARAVVVLP